LYQPTQATIASGDLADAFDVDAAALLDADARHRDELTQSRSIRFDGRMARVHAQDGRQTLVAFCDLAGLDDVFRRLSAASSQPATTGRPSTSP
jgi:hypothetical protein